ncbi:MAG: hypothetical protein EZS28_030836, partial [Streblomastix strix]
MKKLDVLLMGFTMEKETLRFDETVFFTKQSDSNGI